MKFNKQTDYLWKNDIMTQGTTWIDRIGRWGCLITCIANLYQEHKQAEFTPKTLNEMIIENKGYYYLSGKTKKESEASFLDWKIVKKLLKFEHYDNVKEGNIARVILFGGGHYINCLEKVGDYYLCYDVNDGQLKFYKKDKITKFIRIKWLD